MRVEEGRSSECRFVMKRIEVETLPHTKVGRLLRMVILYKKLLELFKGGKQMNEIKTSCAPTDQKWETWEDIDWNKCQHWVRKLQGRIVKAQKEGKHNKVKALQWMLTHSFYAKALAVKRVTSNKGSKTSGVDKAIWSTSNIKFLEIVKLKRSGYQPQPLKRVNIKKSNGKLRPLGIPTMKDRAMQALYLMALDPVSETTADSNSYGFRKERSCADAIGQCFNVLSKNFAAQWILEADIKGCFDHISHDWLLNNIPMDKVMLKKWLKSGYVFNKELFPTEEGTPQGGIISPTLANMTLDGLQTMLALKFHKKGRGKKPITPQVNFVRYADDFIITGRNKEMLEHEIMPLVKEFLSVRGLTLSEEKTKITHIDEGFDFLGFNLRKYDGKLLIKPSKEKVKKFLDNIRETIDVNKACKQETLIRLLNPKITGWANYYKHCVASDTFCKTDHQIFCKLWQWSNRRHSEKGAYWIKQKYFRKIGNRNWRFAVDFNLKGTNSIMSLKRLADTKITRYVKTQCDANPYDPEWKEYFEKRETNKMFNSIKGRESLLYLWKKQKRVCPICGEPIDKEKSWSVSELSENGKSIKFLVHSSCRGRSNYFNKREDYEPVS